jgi:predicted DNA-binding protein (UPF0251 family)
VNTYLWAERPVSQAEAVQLATAWLDRLRLYDSVDLTQRDSDRRRTGSVLRVWHGGAHAVIDPQETP